MTVRTDDSLHPDLAEAVRRLVDKFQPERIYLFGSQARGDADQDSDYDILVVIQDSTEPGFRRAQSAHSALWGLAISLEVLVMTEEEFARGHSITASFPATVEREGKLLYAA